MSRMPVVRAIPFTLCCSYFASLLACSPGPSSQGTSTKGQLTGAEWSAYVADSLYVQGLTRHNAAARLNLADPHQYNFAMSRLKLAGKTAANSPYLFERIETRRQVQLAAGTKVGSVAQVLDNPGGLVEMHYIETADIGSIQAPHVAGARQGNRAAAPISLATGTASSTFPGGIDYTYLDISVSTSAGNPVASLNFTEQFDSPDGNPGANVVVSTSGDTSVSNLTRYTFESFKFEELPDGDFEDSYVHVEAGTIMPRAPQAKITLSPPQIDAPQDLVGPNNGAPDDRISVCMDRQWTNDCDYVIDTGAVDRHRIKMPLKGGITLASAHQFDGTAIDAMRTALDNNQVPATDPGKIALVLTNYGGGCDVDQQGSLNPGMSAFWDHVTISPDSKTLYWDATAANAVFFDELCSQIQSVAKLTMRISAPVVEIADPAVTSSISFTISSDTTVERATYLPTITITNSCLAEGTEIDVGGGKLAPIESLHIGQTIFNPYAADRHTLTIEDTSKGVERSPMVRIRDAAGRMLLMTEMHPIATPDRGMVQARALRTGDLVMTVAGPSPLVEVSREPYSGKVYNLKVGSQSEMAALASDQTVMHANGFVVGDGQIQHKYEDQAIRQGTRPRHVAEQWRRDYELSPLRK